MLEENINPVQDFELSDSDGEDIDFDSFISDTDEEDDEFDF